MRINLAAIFFVWLVLSSAIARASERALTLLFGQNRVVFTAAQLLARQDVVDLIVPEDVTYARAMTYRAVPLLNLLGGHLDTGVDTLEARATDGFVAQIPAALVNQGRSNGAVAWIAIEEPSRPWPNLPEKSQTAGPFYLVWQHPERTNIGPEQWPYALAVLSGVASPMQRWPQMAVASSVSVHAPEWRGMHAYVKHCLACHRINGAGEGTIGPDMAQPMSPTAYMTTDALRLLIRDPTAVRDWPTQAMPGFSKEVMSDTELDDLIAYLKHMAPPE